MINFNFNNVSLDFLKKIPKKDALMVLAFLLIIGFSFKKEISSFIGDDEMHQHDIFTRDIENQIELDYILQDIVKKYDIDYVNVNLFHNGIVSTSGYHFKKMSCIAESKKLGKLPQIDKLQNWVIEPFKEKLLTAKHDGFVYIDSLTSDPDPYFSTTIPRFGFNSVLYIALFDPRKLDNGRPHFVGFISFGWEKSTNFNENTLVSMLKEKERINEFILK